MGNRLSKIATRTGDQGTTGMADGSRLSKNDIRVRCLGEVDELNACIGLIVSSLSTGDIHQLLFGIQHDLFDLGAELCQPGKALIQTDYVTALEAQIESFNQSLPALKEFILPGGSQAVAFIHLARTVCRRVERALISLKEDEQLNPETGRYINRLSDLLFVLARAQSVQDGGSEIYWNSKYSRVNR
ncbi:MAG: cob(I)alamin adenosyltransferase [Planctomycetota bacterium]|jgi:cob(I)alamin adenosyltransferase